MDIDNPSAAEIAATCVCLNAQRAARAVARRYDAAFRPVGLTSGQFAILAALDQKRPIGLSDLSRVLGLERTTLTRNLAPLEVRALIASSDDPDDGRMRRVVLTTTGRAALKAAIPLWREAQAESLTALAEASWPPIRTALARLGAI